MSVFKENQGLVTRTGMAVYVTIPEPIERVLPWSPLRLANPYPRFGTGRPCLLLALPKIITL
jgi:hypothetical protein